MILDTLRIWQKLALSFTLLVVATLGINALVAVSVMRLEAAGREKEAALTAAGSGETLLYLVLEQMNAVRGFTILGQPAFEKTYLENRDKTQVEVDRIAGLVGDHPQVQTHVAEFRAAVAEWQKEKLSPALELARSPATRAEAQEIAGKKQLTRIRDALKALQATQAERLVQASENAAGAAWWAHRMLGLGAFLAVVLAAGFAWLLTRTIARPTAAMADTMAMLATGRHDIDIAGQGRADEIGDMARATEIFREAQIARLEAEAAQKRMTDEQAEVVTALSGALQRLAGGDLGSGIENPLGDSYERLRADYNRAVERLRGLVAAVIDSLVIIGNGSTEIRSAADDLARRTEGNAASIAETSATMVAITERLRDGASASSTTLSRAAEARGRVDAGRQTAVEAVGAMNGVAADMQGIDSVIEGLDKIAFQTRVLAMNAAVEAGRAGEAGRGFAVVADLVSALAMRAEEEAKRVREQLTATQAGARLAVDAVARVDAMLALIATDVEEVHELVGAVAASNEAQSAAVSQTSIAIAELDNATQRNAAMVEETSAATRNLDREIEALTERAAQFSVGAPATRKTVQIASAAKHARAPVTV